MPEIRPPWTDEQVAALNRYQTERLMHPFTCAKRREHRLDEGVLIATSDGWRCPVETCDYTQGWAHAFMTTDLSYLNPFPVKAKS